MRSILSNYSLQLSLFFFIYFYLIGFKSKFFLVGYNKEKLSKIKNLNNLKKIYKILLLLFALLFLLLSILEVNAKSTLMSIILVFILINSYFRYMY